MNMMDKNWTAERVAEALVDAVKRGIGASVTIGVGTYVFKPGEDIAELTE